MVDLSMDTTTGHRGVDGDGDLDGNSSRAMTAAVEGQSPISRPDSLDPEKMTPTSIPKHDLEAGNDPDDSAWEVTWQNGDLDPGNPRSKPHLQKWLATITVSLASLCVTCTSSIYTSAYTSLSLTFPNAPRLLLISGLSFFILGLGIGPMLLAPLSEFFGRRPIYLVSFVAFIICLLPCALAESIAVLLVFRFLSGFAGSAFLTVAGGTVGDLWSGEELSAPMMIFTASPFIGPTLGPLLGGFINAEGSGLGWRWTFWVIVIWAGVMLGMLVFFVPESYHPVLLRNRARELRLGGEERWWARIERTDKGIVESMIKSCSTPWLLLIWEPMVLVLCTFTAVLLGVLYLFFQAFPLVFMSLHGMNLQQTGLTFLGLFVGMTLGVLSDPIWRRLYHYQTTTLGRTPIPELRLPAAILGGILVPIGLFWFGFTSRADIHWIVPIIGSAVFALGTLLAYSGVFTFLVEAYPSCAASALAANSLLRSVFAAGFPLFGGGLYSKVGMQWGGGVLGFIAVGLAPWTWVFYKWGERIRRGSRFARAA